MLIDRLDIRQFSTLLRTWNAVFLICMNKNRSVSYRNLVKLQLYLTNVRV